MSFLTLMILSISSDAKQAPDCPQGLEAFTQGLHKKLRKDCAYCHGGQGPGPSHSVEDPKASYKMIKNLLNLSNPAKMDGLSKSKFITTGGNNHCASMGVECNTSSEELMSLVKPWIETEIKSCSVATTNFITSEKTSVLNQGKLTLKIPGYDQVQVQAILDTHVASDVTRGYVKLKNFKICHPNAQVTVRGIKILIDGEEDNYATLKERTFEPCNQELNPETLLFSAQNSPTTQQSQIQVIVGSITVGQIQTSSNCHYPKYYNEVVTPLIQSSCLECHHQSNLNPLTCDFLIESYKQSGALNWKQHFMSGQHHSKIGSTLQIEALTQYLNLETTNDNNSINKLSKGFEKLIPFLNPEATKDSSLTGRIYSTFNNFKNLLQLETSENLKKYTTVTTGIKSVHTCALNEITHQAKCWGNNYRGQLGSAKEIDKKFLKEVAPLPFKNVKQLVAGDAYTCALFNDGTAKCWGDNTSGQLGYGYVSDYKLPNYIEPLLPLKNIKQLAAGASHTCALFKDGTAKCWGLNFWGELGYEGTSEYKLLKDVDFLPLRNIKQIATGMDYTCAVFNDGRAKCWGYNDFGQLGHESIRNYKLLKDVDFLPLRNIKQIFTGYRQTCAVFNDGRAKCWGGNLNRELGYEDTSDYKFLKDVDFLPLNNIQQIATGDGHTCAVLNDGKAKCWGLNFWGQLGYGDRNNRILKDADFLPLNNIQQIATGDGHTCAVLDFGRIKCWGRNDAGQLGYDDLNILNETKPISSDVPFFPLLEFFK